MQAQVVTRGPYLCMSTPSSITIKWTTDIPTSSAVRIGFVPNLLNGSYSNSLFVTEHTVIVNNLFPDTKYYYAIGTTTSILFNDVNCYFKTAPHTSATYSSPIRFWAMGDMAKQTQQQINVRDAYLNFKGNKHVDGWIMLGDNAYVSGLNIEYQLGFFNYYQDDILKNTVLWPVLGNHDYANDYNLRTSHQVPCLSIFDLPQQAECGGVPSGNERYYSFDYGNVHIVNLDSYGLENVNGTYYALSDTSISPQVAWLKSDLSANHLPWVIVCFHHPPYSLGTHNSDTEFDLIAIRNNVIPILESYNVDLVLCGHSHTYERSQYMKSHTGIEASFDSSIHVLQHSSGASDGSINSCSYIKNEHSILKKDSGVIYMVVGSGGAIPQAPFAGWPHNAMYYSNYQDNGSLMLTIEGNRLDAEWISTDTLNIVKDKFTIFKNVGNTKHIHTNYPDTLTLKASWKSNDYSWSNGDSNQSIQVIVQSDTIFTVTDLYTCITDTFIVDNKPNNINDFTPEYNVLEVYPNPCREKLMIHLPHKGHFAICLMTIDGRIVSTEKIHASQDEYEWYLPNGITTTTYFLIAEDEYKRRYFTKVQLSN